MRRISLYKFYNLCSKTCNIFTIFQFNNTFFRKKKKKTDLIIPNWFNNTYNIFHIIISFSLLERPGLGGYEYCLVVQCEKDMETQKSIFFPSIFWGTQTSFSQTKGHNNFGDLYHSTIRSRSWLKPNKGDNNMWDQYVSVALDNLIKMQRYFGTILLIFVMAESHVNTICFLCCFILIHILTKFLSHF